MEGWNIKNSEFIRYFLKSTMDEIDQRKELFDLINFDGIKVVHVAGELLELDRTKLTCMLCTLNCGNTCFSDILKLEFSKNLIRGSKILLPVFGRKFYHCYEFY